MKIGVELLFYAQLAYITQLENEMLAKDATFNGLSLFLKYESA